MSWADLHAEAERLAIEAQMAVQARRFNDASGLYKQAAEFERQALDQVDPSKSRTRGITAVSAVALWFKAGEYALAEQLAYSMLAEAAIPDFAREELRNLVQAIWTESQKRQAGVEFAPGQILVSVKGGEIVTGGAPLDLIVEKVQNIQLLFYRTIEFLGGMPHRRVGRPAKEIQETCRPWLFQSAPGSYQFSVAVQKPPQLDLFKVQIEPDEIAERFLEIVEATGRDDAALEKAVPDEQYRNTFLKLARNLAPTEKGKTFERIEFRTAGESRPTALGAESRVLINRQLRQKPTTSPEADEQPEDLRGILRAVHLDKDWLDLVVDGVPMHVVGLQDAVDDVIGPMVNRQVVVKVLRNSRGEFKFVDIELAD